MTLKARLLVEMISLTIYKQEHMALEVLQAQHYTNNIQNLDTQCSHTRELIMVVAIFNYNILISIVMHSWRIRGMPIQFKY